MFDWINKILNGKKTVIAGIAAVANAVHLIAQSLADGFQTGDLNIIGTQIVVVMGIIGLGHKAKKIEDLLKK